MSITDLRRTFLPLSLLFFAGVVSAQVGADGRRMFPGQEEPQPQGVRESIDKMRVEKEKKDFDEMLARGEEIARIADGLKASFSRSGELDAEDGVKIARLEKLVKKIRDGLGGDWDDGKTDDDDAADKPQVPNSTAAAIDALKEQSTTLLEQLKKTTRFTISALAIYSSNSVLKITKSLKPRQ